MTKLTKTKAQTTKAPSQTPSKAKRKCVGSVRFQTSKNIVGVSASAQIKEAGERREACWYQKHDLKRFRHDNCKTALVVQYKQIPCDPKSYVNVLQRTYRRCRLRQVPSTEEMQHLLYWHEFCPERRGLEKICAPETASINRQRVQHMRQTIVSIQDSLREKGASLETISTRLRKVYSALALPDKTYSRVLAIADAASSDRTTTH